MFRKFPDLFIYLPEVFNGPRTSSGICTDIEGAKTIRVRKKSENNLVKNRRRINLKLTVGTCNEILISGLCLKNTLTLQVFSNLKIDSLAFPRYVDS